MSREIAPREVAHLFFRHKFKFVTVFLTVVSLGVVAIAVMKPRYRSEALLFVRLGRENVALDPTASFGTGASVVSVPQGREDEINSVVELLNSRMLAEKVVVEFGPDALLGKDGAEDGRAWAASAEGNLAVVSQRLNAWWERLFMPEPANPAEDALELVRKRLSVAAPKRSNIIAISYDGPTPQLAQGVVEKVIDIYLEDHVRLNRTAGSHNFFEEQTNQTRRKLLEAETKMRELKNSTGLASVKDQRYILVERIGRLEDDRLKTAAELATYEAEIAALTDKLDKLPQTRVTQRVSGMPNTAADGMRQQLYALQLKQQELMSTFTDEARQVKEIRRQIEEAQGILAREEYDRTQSTNAADPTFVQLHLSQHTKQTVAMSLRAKTEALDEQLASARTALEKLNGHEMELAQLQRDVDLHEASFRNYSQNLEQARIDQALKLERISNISVAQPATLSMRSVRPTRLVTLGVSLAAALAAAVGLVLVAEYFDRSIRTEEDVERRLAIPALISIPCMDAEQMTLSGTHESHDYALHR